MKKICAAVILAIVMVMLSSVFCFGAESLKIEKTVPYNGQEKTTKDNMCVKVYFNKAVGNKASEAVNKNKFKITNDDGKAFPTRIYYNSKNPKFALIIIDTNKVKARGSSAIQDNTYYTCTLSKGFAANDGGTLPADQKIRFKTLNQTRDTMVYMVMMFVMFGGMIFFTMRQSQKQKSNEAVESGKKSTFNPYKEAQKTGKSVQQVVAEHKKELEKQKKKQAKKDAGKDRDNAFRDGETYRVKRPRPVSEGGSTYKTGRRAVAEAEKAKREAEKAARKANNYGKKKK
jgi:hypothetical protein